MFLVFAGFFLIKELAVFCTFLFRHILTENPLYFSFPYGSWREGSLHPFPPLLYLSVAVRILFISVILLLSRMYEF